MARGPFKIESEEKLNLVTTDVDFVVAQLMSDIVDNTLLPSIEGTTIYSKLFKEALEWLNNILKISDKWDLKNLPSFLFEKAMNYLNATSGGIFINFNGILGCWVGTFQTEDTFRQIHIDRSITGSVLKI